MEQQLNVSQTLLALPSPTENSTTWKYNGGEERVF
jgi:hypothetical protein